jgi:hypothetical protein
MRSLFIQTLVEDAVVGWAVGLSVLMLLIQWLIVGGFMWQLPPEIPLWYSLPAGSSQLSSRDWFLLLPMMAAAATLVNLIVIRLSLRGARIFVQMMAWMQALLVFLATLSMVHIVLMVT